MATTEEYERKITNASNKELAEEINELGQKLDRIRIELFWREVEEDDKEIKERARIGLLATCYLLKIRLPELVAAIRTIKKGENKE